ncbi:helix-turn-helix domain-containing protein [Streptomyces sp. NPDC093105]|uniref:helix-turn-helix domain-containing protein n=1 Tax=Streptomyces sp. NPDC093105 TaxID=3366029 RepID=UPI0038202B28
MASTQPNPPPRGSGLIHRNVPLTAHFLVISKELPRCPGISLLAIGLAVHLQSLPPGASVGIKAVAARFPESEFRVSAAMRELEALGFLQRIRERLPNGRIVSRTISYNRPRADLGVVRRTPPPPVAAPATAPEVPHPVMAAPGATVLVSDADREPDPDPDDDPEPDPGPGSGPGGSGPGNVPGPRTAPCPSPGTAPDPRPAPGPSPDAAADASPYPAPAPTTAPASADPARAPHTPSAPPPLADVHQAGAELLAGLRVREPRLLLSERDVRRLAPGVTVWLERGADPAAVGRTLRAGLPRDLASPAGLLAHRLKVLLPPPLPAGPPPPAVPAPRVVCEDCERPFPASVTAPGRCRECQEEARLDPHAA